MWTCSPREGARQAARGIYTSSDGRYVAQYTLLNLRDTASADALVQTLTTLHRGGWVQILETDKAVFPVGGHTEGSGHAMGHYAGLVWYGRADGADPAPQRRLPLPGPDGPGRGEGGVPPGRRGRSQRGSGALPPPVPVGSSVMRKWIVGVVLVVVAGAGGVPVVAGGETAPRAAVFRGEPTSAHYVPIATRALDPEPLTVAEIFPGRGR